MTVWSSNVNFYSVSCAPSWKLQSDFSFNIFMFSLGFLLPVSLIIFSSLTVYTSVHNVTAWSEWGTLSGPDQLWSSSLIGWDHNVSTPATLYHRDIAKGTQSLLLSVEPPAHNRFLSPPIWITGLEFFTLNKMPSLSFHPWFPGSLLHTVGSSPEESSKEAEESSLHGELNLHRSNTPYSHQ